MIPHLSVAVLVLVLVLTGFFATTSRVSVSILRGLHVYILPEAGEKEETTGKGKRRSSGPGRQKKGKKESRDGWDESNAQILRIDLAKSQLETRKYFQEYDEAVIYTILGLTNFVTREFLQFFSSSLQRENEWAQHLAPDDRITFMVGAFTLFKLLRLLARVSYDHRLGRGSERLVSWGVGFLGFSCAYIVLLVVPLSLIDFGIDTAVLDAGNVALTFVQKKGLDAPFDLAVSPDSVKPVLAICAGIISGLVFGSCLRNVKNYWIGTDHLLGNIDGLKRAPLVWDFLILNLVLPPFVALMWVKPVANVFVLPPDSGSATVAACGGGPRPNGFGELDPQSCEESGGFSFAELGSNVQDVISRLWTIVRGVLSRDYDSIAHLGFLEATFSQMRLWGLFLTGFLQLCLFRLNLQSHCNGALLSWYKGLHGSKVHNPEVTKARIFVKNYFVCRVALECLVPGVLVLHFLGLARTRGIHLEESAELGAFFFAPSFVRALMMFGTWWAVLSWAVQTCILLVLFRFGTLSMLV